MGIKFKAKYTDDGSIGLYSDAFSDIYHSTFGALSEAYEKFIFPADFYSFLSQHDEIRILDLCFGIGYNSKAFLNFYFNILNNENFDFFDFNNQRINSIYTNNVFSKKNHKIVLHAVEIDKNLIKLSPFINQSKCYLKLNTTNNIFNYIPDKFLNEFYIHEFINIIFLIKIVSQYKSNYLSDDLISILTDKANKKFFNQNLVDLIKISYYQQCDLSYIERLMCLLHNIYYKYISNSYKNALKVLKNPNFDFKVFNYDVRSFIKNSNIRYDFIFLDAFSPNKAPNLWTVEFFNYLYKHLSDDGKILTYSNSASVRNAFLKNGFFVGKIFNKFENRFTGTIAAKNQNLIKCPLDEFDLGLINTKAGICYHDNLDLSLTNNEIIENRNNEFENSNLLSSTKYKKGLKCHMML